LTIINSIDATTLLVEMNSVVESVDFSNRTFIVRRRRRSDDDDERQGLSIDDEYRDEYTAGYRRGSSLIRGSIRGGAASS